MNKDIETEFVPVQGGTTARVVPAIMLCLTGLVVVGLLCLYGCRMKNVSSVERTRTTASAVPAISVYDEGNLLRITIEDIGKYHGDICPCVAITFRATQLAIRELWKEKAPERSDFKIISRSPTQGCHDVIEFITRARTRDDFRIELPEGTDNESLMESNFAFIFIRKSTSDSVEISVKEHLFPNGFFEMRRKANFGKDVSSETKQAFELAKDEVRRTFMESGLDKLFVYEKK